jgi:hypothetical protein
VTETIIILAGTSLCGAGYHFLRLWNQRKRLLERQVAAANGHGSAALQQHLDDLTQSVILRALDIDTTTPYRIPPPFEDDGMKWPPRFFMACPMPGRDTVARILQGDEEDWEFLNPDAFRWVISNDATGGTRPNGRAAIQVVLGAVDKELREAFRSILERRRELARDMTAPIRVIEGVGTFGGFASGSHDVIRGKVMDIATEFGLRVDFIPILVVPGTLPTKDPANTDSVTHAVLKEQAAEGTGHAWRLEKRNHSEIPQLVRDGFRPALFVSDTNSAPTTPVSLSAENLYGLVGELISALVFTPVGGTLAAIQGDFEAAASATNTLGEHGHGRAIGMSAIVLNTEKLFVYSAARLTLRFLTGTLQQADEEQVRQAVEGFLRAHDVVEGAGRQLLAARLLQRRDVQHLVTIERLRQLFLDQTTALQGEDLLNGAAQRLREAVRQAGDLTAALAARRPDVGQWVLADLDAKLNVIVSDPDQGIEVACQFAETAGAIADNMIAAAGADTTVLNNQVAGLRRSVQHIETVYRPAVAAKSWLHRWAKRRQIAANALLYRDSLLRLREAEMRLEAHLAAVECLQEMSKQLQIRLAQLHQVRDVVAAKRDKTEQLLQKLENFKSSFDCPSGLDLTGTREDLEGFHRRYLPEEDEQQAARDIFLRLRNVEGQRPLEVLGDLASLATVLGSAAETSLRAKVESLHVADEVLRRYQGDPQSLDRAVQQRDTEAFPYLPLKDGVRPRQQVRWVFGDASRLGWLLPVLSRVADPNPTPYTLIDTGDPTCIRLVQVSAVFSLSDWKYCDRARNTYFNTGRINPFERHHVYPGQRFWPELGQRLTEADVRVLVFKAWLLDRLKWDAQRGWYLLPADQSEGSLPLGKQLETLFGPHGYGRGVDICSHFDCLFLKFGPPPIQQRVDLLASILQGKANAENELEEQLARVIDAATLDRIEEQLEWWRRNTVPAAMEWGRKTHPRALAALTK